MIANTSSSDDRGQDGSMDYSLRSDGRSKRVAAVGLGILLALAGTSASGQALYRLRDLTPGSASGFPEAWAINNAGQVTGTVDRRLPNGAPFDYPAFRGDRMSTQFLDTLGGQFHLGADINASGQVGGYSQNTNGEYRPAFWNGVGIQDLGSLGGYDGIVRAINNLGWAVGFSNTVSGEPHAFLWDGAAMRDLGGLGGLGGPESDASDVNDAGQIVGYSTNADGVFRATLWDSTGAHDLGTLAGGLGEGFAIDINEAGHVVGRATSLPDGYEHAFYWDGAAMYDLGTLGGHQSFAHGVNNSGHVIGESNTVTGNSASSHAFIWDGTTMRDLGTLGGNLSQVADINESSHVVGYSTTSSGQPRAFLWDGATLNDLNDFVDPGDSLKSFVTLQFAWAINDRGDVAADGVDSRIGRRHVYLMSVISPTAVALSGFEQPVDPVPTLNKTSSGQIIPLRFHVATPAGVPVTDLTSVSVTMAAKNCANLDAEGSDQIEQYASGSSGLINQGNGNYQFNLKTLKGTSGCQVATLTLPTDYSSTPATLEAYLQFMK